MKRDYDLLEMARDVGVSVEELIRYAAHDELTIFVIAQDWPASSTRGLSDTILVGPVDLVASDLQRSMSADHTVVRQVKIPGTDNPVMLDAPVDVPRGAHFVTAEELQRFRRKHREFSAKQNAELAPYLNERHEYYSPALDAAVRAWLALFEDGEYERGKKPIIPIIRKWLMSNTVDLTSTTIGKIATVVNPKIMKEGGAPQTFS